MVGAPRYAPAFSALIDRATDILAARIWWMRR
jgi:hypothetical protein